MRSCSLGRSLQNSDKPGDIASRQTFKVSLLLGLLCATFNWLSLGQLRFRNQVANHFVVL